MDSLHHDAQACRQIVPNPWLVGECNWHWWMSWSQIWYEKSESLLFYFMLFSSWSIWTLALKHTLSTTIILILFYFLTNIFLPSVPLANMFSDATDPRSLRSPGGRLGLWCPFQSVGYSCWVSWRKSSHFSWNCPHKLPTKQGRSVRENHDMTNGRIFF